MKPQTISLEFSASSTWDYTYYIRQSKIRYHQLTVNIAMLMLPTNTHKEIHTCVVHIVYTQEQILVEI